MNVRFRAVASSPGHLRDYIEDSRKCPAVAYSRALDVNAPIDAMLATIGAYPARRPVGHIVISWLDAHELEGEAPLAGARRILDRLGVERGYQWIAAQHIDTEHPHVHVLLNRVHPLTGKLAFGQEPFLRTLRERLGIRPELNLPTGARDAETWNARHSLTRFVRDRLAEAQPRSWDDADRLLNEHGMVRTPAKGGWLIVDASMGRRISVRASAVGLGERQRSHWGPPPAFDVDASLRRETYADFLREDVSLTDFARSHPARERYLELLAQGRTKKQMGYFLRREAERLVQPNITETTIRNQEAPLMLSVTRGTPAAVSTPQSPAIDELRAHYAAYVGSRIDQDIQRRELEKDLYYAETVLDQAKKQSPDVLRDQFLGRFSADALTASVNALSQYGRYQRAISTKVELYGVTAKRLDAVDLYTFAKAAADRGDFPAELVDQLSSSRNRTELAKSLFENTLQRDAVANLATLNVYVNKEQDAVYSVIGNDGKRAEAFLEKEDRFSLKDGVMSDAAIDAMLLVAEQRYGTINLEGDEQMVKRALARAALLDIKVTNPELQQEYEAERQRVQEREERATDRINARADRARGAAEQMIDTAIGKRQLSKLDRDVVALVADRSEQYGGFEPTFFRPTKQERFDATLVDRLNVGEREYAIVRKDDGQLLILGGDAESITFDIPSGTERNVLIAIDRDNHVTLNDARREQAAAEATREQTVSSEVDSELDWSEISA